MFFVWFRANQQKIPPKQKIGNFPLEPGAPGACVVSFEPSFPNVTVVLDDQAKLQGLQVRGGSCQNFLFFGLQGLQGPRLLSHLNLSLSLAFLALSHFSLSLID